MLQVGACLVSQDGIILGKLIRFLYPIAFLCETWIFTLILLLSGIGYNGFPRGCSDDKLPWAKVGILRELFVLFLFQYCLNILSQKSPCFRNPGLGILWRLSTRKCAALIYALSLKF